DLIAALGGDLPRLDASWMVLGTGDPAYQDMWRTLAAAHPDRVGARIGFDESLAHLIEGGADMFLMPSRYEPSGLNQMYSMRYGTVPIVRGVGGLHDTVVDYAPAPRRPAKPQNGGVAARGAVRSRPKPTGFVFHDYRPDALLEAIVRALTAF